MPDELPGLIAALADRYQIEEELGRGGMATVYLAADLKHERKVALKVMRGEIAAVLGADRFLQEIRVTANLQHPHILPLHDSGEEAGFLYYVMPYVEGETLRQRLEREGQLPIVDVIQITNEIGAALGYAHEQGVIHRDIKPENILLSRGGAILADFGVARALDRAGDGGRTTIGLALGTPSYMSPEQAAGEPNLDGRSDVYALGCVVFEMLGGEVPYAGATPRAILARQLVGEVPSLHVLRSTVRPELEEVLKRALASEAADRYGTVPEFVEAVSRAASGRLRSSVDRMRAVGRQVPLWNVVWGAAAVAAVLAAALILPRFVTAAEEPASLVLFPFNQIGEDVGNLGEGLPDLLAATLDGTVGITVADPAALWRTLRTDSDDLRVPQLDEAMQLARTVSATSVILGSVTAAGGNLVVSGRVYDARDGSVRTTIRASVPAESLGVAINQLALDVVEAVWERDSVPIVPDVSTLASDNIEAVQAYLEAKSELYRGRLNEAYDAIERAVALDSTFALAHLEQFRLRSQILFQTGQPYTGLRPIIDRAMQYRDRLSERNRLRVEAAQALDDTNGMWAISLYERILASDSMDYDARQGLAYAYLNYGWQVDKSVDDLFWAFDRLAEANPGSPVPLTWATRLAALSGDDDRVASYVDRLVQYDTTRVDVASRLGTVRAMRAVGETQDSILRSLASRPLNGITTTLRDLRMASPELAERFLDELMADSLPVMHQRVGLGARAQLWFGEGRITATDSIVRGGQLDDIRATINGYFVSSLMAGVGDSASTARAVDELTAYAPIDSLWELIQTRNTWGAAWGIGGYHAAIGDTLAAREWQRAIAGLPHGGIPEDWPDALSADIAARIAARRGDWAAAETAARRAYDIWYIHSSNALESHPEPGMRFHLAEVLMQTGKTAEAARLYRSFVAPFNWAGFYTARASLALGEIAEADGDFREAALRYGHAVALWERGGLEVADWLLQAETVLQRMLSRIG